MIVHSRLLLLRTGRSVKHGRRTINECSTAPPSARTGRANARRENLIQAARDAFIAHGFHGTSIAQIAQASGVAVGQIYRDFANKEAIVAAIVERDLEEFLSESGLCAANNSGHPEAVRKWIRDFVACEERGDGGRLFAEIMAEASRNERIGEIARSLHQRMHCALTTALQSLVPADVKLERRERVAEMIHTIAFGVFQRRTIDDSYPPTAVINMLMDCINIAIDELQREAG